MIKGKKTAAKKIIADKKVAVIIEMSEVIFNTKQASFLVGKDEVIRLIRNIISVQVNQLDNNFMDIRYTGGEIMEVKCTMMALRILLPSNFFIAAQQSFLVGRLHIMEVLWMKNGAVELVMTEGINIHIPADCKQNLLDELYKAALDISRWQLYGLNCIIK